MSALKDGKLNSFNRRKRGDSTRPDIPDLTLLHSIVILLKLAPH